MCCRARSMRSKKVRKIDNNEKHQNVISNANTYLENPTNLFTLRWKFCLDLLELLAKQYSYVQLELQLGVVRWSLAGPFCFLECLRLHQQQSDLFYFKLLEDPKALLKHLEPSWCFWNCSQRFYSLLQAYHKYLDNLMLGTQPCHLDICFDFELPDDHNSDSVLLGFWNQAQSNQWILHQDWPWQPFSWLRSWFQVRCSWEPPHQ